jgi:hypothetical protein
MSKLKYTLQKPVTFNRQHFISISGLIVTTSFMMFLNNKYFQNRKKLLS